MLASNNASLSSNQCPSGDGNNCVEYNGVFYPLNLSSEAQTGIKIPSGQLAGGQISVAPGATVDLGIDFDGFASILRQGNGQFRLKPVLHAGEVHLASESVNGTLVDATTLKPVPGATGIVALEAQQNVNGSLVYRMVMQTTVDPVPGKFVFCPVPAGTTYDIVAVIETGSGTAAEKLQQIFEPFVTTKGEKGLGIGLWISRNIVEKVGGTIQVRSTTEESRHGTEFTITLPVAEPVRGANSIRLVS